MIAKRLSGALVLVAMSALAWGGPGLQDFDAAQQAFVGHSGCKNVEHLEASYDHGDMANCVLGKSRTLVYELEKSRDDERVHRVKLTWFDFGVQKPDGAPQYLQHGGKGEAEGYLASFLDAYAPCRKEELMEGFFGNGECECRTDDGDFDIRVHQFQNASLVERAVEIRHHHE